MYRSSRTNIVHTWTYRRSRKVKLSRMAEPMISWFKAEDINIMVQSLGDVSLGVFTEQFNVSGDLRDLDLSNSVQSVPTEELMALLKANQGKTKINAIGKDTFAGDYKKVEGIHRDGDADIPFIIEAWATAVDAEKNNGDHTIEVITNRSLTLSRATLEVKSGRAAISSGGWVMRHRGKGPMQPNKGL